MDEYDLRFISNEILNKIGKETVVNESKIINHINDDIKESVSKWKEELKKYYIDVYKMALKDYKKYLDSIQKNDNIKVAKKRYQLK